MTSANPADLDQLQPWQRNLTQHFDGVRLEEGILRSTAPLSAEEGYLDIDYRSILDQPYRTVSAEHPHYLRMVHAAYRRLTSSDAVVADLGTGDGRMVLELLAAGCQRVIATDVGPANLLRLRARLAGQEGRALLVEDDIARSRLPDGCCDLVMAVGVLTVLGDDYHRGVQTCARLARPGAWVLTVDPTDFGAAMYAIARHDLHELGRVLSEGTKAVDIEDPEGPRVSVRSARAMEEAHRAAGLEVEDRFGIPLSPSLLFGALKQTRPHSEHELATMARISEQMTERFPQAWRAAGLLCRKLGG